MQNTKSRDEKVFWISMGLFFVAFSLVLFFINDKKIASIVQLLLGTLIVIVILRFPIIGLGLVIVSTPLTELLPQIPLLSSVIPLIGVFTFFGFLLSNHYREKIRWKLTSVEIFSLLFILWAVFSNPNASLIGDDRAWALSFAQLWLLLWMARQFVRSKQDHQKIMGVITCGIFITAIAAIQQVGLNLDMANRASGFSGGANTAARYLVYGVALLIYLQNHFAPRKILRIILLAGIFIFIVATIVTGSRTGVLLLVAMTLLQLIRFLSEKRLPIVVLLVFVAGFAWYINQAKGTVIETTNIFDAITKGSDTVGYRYDLWNSGLAMVLAHPITGVGIGRFGDYLPSYWNSGTRIGVNTPHNTYIEVFAETGLIGFLLFLAVIFTSIMKYLKRMKCKEFALVEINWTWLSILLLLLFGAFTKTDLLDKLFWFLLGVDVFFGEQYLKRNKKVIDD